MKKPSACIIVDPFASSESLADALIMQNIIPIAILTRGDFSEKELMTRFAAKKYREVIYCKMGSNLSVVKKLSTKYDIKGFIYGLEGDSIQYADKIAKHCFPQFKNKGPSSIRSNKYEMLKKLDQDGLYNLPQILVNKPKLDLNQKKVIEKKGRATS